MEIQTANIIDLGALRRLEAACFDKDAWPFLDLIAVLTWRSDPPQAVDTGEMIGFVTGDRFVVRVPGSQPLEVLLSAPWRRAHVAGLQALIGCRV
jgi:hypothetical protein